MCKHCQAMMIQGVYCHETGCTHSGDPAPRPKFNERIESIRLESGELPSFAWPGGYPLFYICEDNGVLCPKCANEEGDPDDAQWNLAAVDANWEDPSMYCDHCGKRIESAYADDDEGGDPS